MRLVLKVQVPQGVKVDPRAWWSEVDTLAVGQGAVALIQRRSESGIDAFGRPFAPYSTKGPIYINPNLGTGALLTPKGGQRTYVGKGRKKRGVTMRFDGGYREYKAKSRKLGKGKVGPVNSPYAAATAEVDLVLSGRMLNSLRVRSHTRLQALVGVGDEVKEYAQAVHDQRPFVGLTDKDIEVLLPGIEARLARNLARIFGGPA